MKFFAPIAGLCLALLSPFAAQSEGRSIIVLDASGSMWGQIDGRAKLEIAREALAEVLRGLPADTEMGLMAYGHRTEGDCADIELIVPPAIGTGPAITEAAQNMSFVGKTPLTESVRQAALALRSSEEKATVILITDGIETCSADPCALGTELESTGVDFTAHVVGFGLSAEEGASVSCLAENTGGVYIEASNASTLKDALQATVVVEPPPPPPPPPPTEMPTTTVEVPVTVIPAYNFAPTMVLKEGGPVITDGSQSWELFRVAAGGQRGDGLSSFYGPTQTTFEPGDYILLARLGLAEVELPVTLTAQDVAAPVVVMNAGTLIVHPRGAEGGPIETGAAVLMTNAAGLDWTNYGDTNIVIPAGDIKIAVTVGMATVEQATEIAPGQTVELDMVAGAGLAVVDGYYVEGMLMDTTQHTVEIVEAKKALDGSRKYITTSYGPAQNFTLPAGDYVAIVTMDAASTEMPFTVKVGERVDVPVVLNAGVLFVAAPGATSIEVYDGKVDIQGNRTSRSFQYTEQMTLTAPGGDYLVQAKMADETVVEATASIKPGERTEISIP